MLRLNVFRNESSSTTKKATITTISYPPLSKVCVVPILMQQSTILPRCSTPEKMSNSSPDVSWSSPQRISEMQIHRHCRSPLLPHRLNVSACLNHRSSFLRQSLIWHVLQRVMPLSMPFLPPWILWNTHRQLFRSICRMLTTVVMKNSARESATNMPTIIQITMSNSNIFLQRLKVLISMNQVILATKKR